MISWELIYATNGNIFNPVLVFMSSAKELMLLPVSVHLFINKLCRKIFVPVLISVMIKSIPEDLHFVLCD